jgi:hypothetical protein
MIPLEKSAFRILTILTLFVINVAHAQDQSSSFWPKEINTKKGKVVIYQPQPEVLKGDVLEARAAISVQGTGEPAPIFGAIWLTAQLDVNKTIRLVRFVSAKVIDVRFPENVEEEKISRFRKFLEEEMTSWQLELNYDQFLASVDQMDVIQNTGFENNAPKIVFRKTPAVLIVIDQAPKYKELEKGYHQLVNTSAFILKKKKKHYLYGGGTWFKTKELMGGWKKIRNVATNLKKIEKKYNSNKEDPMMEKPDEYPEIVMAQEPTELIVTAGDLSFKPIEGSQLLYVDNTESDLFMDVASQNYYLLLSGRWFVSKTLDGAWVNIPADDISKEFLKIPEESIKGEVLAAVPGSNMAREAVLDANIPQTAAIKRDATASVKYDGEPSFERIAGTTLLYAVNTSSAVFKTSDTYFLCDNAVWFRSKSPMGPWVVSETRPVEIDKIPASNPNYNVKYVYIYSTTPDVIYVGYTPGYTGCYVYGPTVVYGTGIYYHGWHGAYYYPRPVTYGYSVRYSPYHGWSMGVSVGFGGPGYWYHGHGYWGPPMYRPPYYRPPYHHRPPGYRPPGYRPPTHRPPSNRPGQPSHRPSTQPVASTRPSSRNNIYNNKQNRMTPSTRPSTRPSTGQPATRPSNGSTQTRPSTQPSSRPNNNVYTDKSGNVYKKSNNGWESRQNNQWSSPSQQPSRNTNQSLDQSYQNRQRGTQRTQNYNQSRPSAPSRGRR